MQRSGQQWGRTRIRQEDRPVQMRPGPSPAAPTASHLRARPAAPARPIPGVRPPAHDERSSTRAQRAWHEGQLEGGSDVSLPQMRVGPRQAPGQAPRQVPRQSPPAERVNYTNHTAYAGPVATPLRPRVNGGADASGGSWQRRTADDYGTDGRSGAANGSRAGSYPGTSMARRAPSARPLTREQRLSVIEHLPGDERVEDVAEQPAQTTGSTALVVSGVGDGVPEFTQQMDAFIAVTSAQQRIILPRRRRAQGSRAAQSVRAVAQLGARASIGFLLLVALMTIMTALTGHAPIPVQALSLAGFKTAAGVSSQWSDDADVVSRVPAYTQLKRTDLYDSPAQAQAWGGSACSAAVLAEILTAYGVQHATIGEMIDELGSDITTQWGLVSYDGFGKVASQHGLRADVYLDHPLSYAQMMYITNTLHMPLIVNVRATSGYYHYLSGGHFLVMTGGDNNTVRLVDSSEYYIKSLPLSTFMGMYRNRSVAIVPQGYQYKLP